MRLQDLLESDYNDDLRSEVITLLTAVSAEGIDEIATQNLLNDLETQGFSVDADTLLSILGELDIVSTASDDKITIATSDAAYMVGSEADDIEADKVDNMATSQATKDIGEDADYDPTASYREMGTARLMSMKNYGLGKQRDYARDELARRSAEGHKWKWDADASSKATFNENVNRMRTLAGIQKKQKGN